MLMPAWITTPDGNQMFSRRRTDQVYTTLQQVQRRISEQGGGPQPLAGHAKPASSSVHAEQRSGTTIHVDADTAIDDNPAYGTETHVSVMEAPHASVLTSTETRASLGSYVSTPVSTVPQSFNQKNHHVENQPASQEDHGAIRRGVIHIGREMASLLIILWLCSMCVCYLLGRSYGAPGAGMAPGAAGNRQPAEEKSVDVAPASLYLLVLQSELATPESVKNYRTGAADLNKWAQGNPRSGLKPWFSVREPENGNVELIYGVNNGRMGIAEKDAKIQAILTKPRSEGGGGYGQAIWVMTH